jgi:hypothetical protein
VRCSAADADGDESASSAIKAAMMSFLDYALTLITLASLFILGPALGHAVVSCFNWQSWSVPIQHLVVGLSTMAAVSTMIFAYGFLWERSPTVVAWYGWVQDVTVASKGKLPGPVEIRPPPLAANGQSRR